MDKQIANLRNAVGTKYKSSETGRRIRFDQGTPGGVAAGGPGRGSLLGLFGGFGNEAQRARPRFVPDRRADDRVHHVECLAWVGWKKFRGFAMNDAVLVDISRGGARIFLDKAPPPQKPVWIFLETPDTRAIVRARVIETELTKQNQCVLRIEFEKACPYQFFEAAVCGLTAADPKTRPAKVERSKSYQNSRGLAG